MHSRLAVRLMKRVLVFVFVASCLRFLGEAVGASPETSSAATNGFVALGDPARTGQFRLYTSASPESRHLFNAFDLEAYGGTLLQALGGERLQKCRASSKQDSLHSILINGKGPNLSATNDMVVTERASGPEWFYVG